MASLSPLRPQGERWTHVVVRKEKDPLVSLGQTNDIERFWRCSRSVLSAPTRFGSASTFT
uniref:Uncharacterized protein n=1 Tax=Ralstonia solanacearum TaxID=305 RepID=A0A0S4WUQ4_RALSL|nr:protein of unknown function [Ralstonia solanacearum]CUV31418.1 protein of unknown function [Ralstonia solanacearum]CUV55257.1 protein of unknown function [Ralstonia solanacearum]